MCLKFQTQIQLCMERFFSGWADIASKRTCIVFWISLVVYIGVTMGMGMSQKYEDESIIWTPSGNPTLKAQEKAEKLFPVEEKFWYMSIIMEPKDGAEEGILTVGALKEMADWEAKMRAIVEWESTTTDANLVLTRDKKGDTYKYEDICQQYTQTYEYEQTCTTVTDTNTGVITVDKCPSNCELLIEGGQQKLDDKGEPVCITKGSVDRCASSQMLLDLVYDPKTENYDTSITQEKYMELIHKAKGNPLIYTSPFEFIDMTRILGEIKTDSADGEPVQINNSNYADEKKNPAKEKRGFNKIKSAQAVQYTYIIEHSRNPQIDEKSYLGWQEQMHEMTDEWSKNTKHVTIHLFSIQGLFDSFSEDIEFDQNLIVMAILAVGIYTFLALGNCSPIHCRCCVALTGLICIILAYTCGFGLMFIFGAKTTGVHTLIPFLLIGIGVDDMFVMCNALDQTKLEDKAFVRVHAALGHAGPAITITSLTNALAFAFGALSSLEALKSFCLFASLTIVFLYLLVMTVFLCVLIWDTRRVEKKWTECCNLFSICGCGEQNPLCCCGFCTTPKQRAYCGIEPSEADKAKMQAAKDKATPAQLTSLEASCSERSLGKCFAPCVLSNIGRIVLLIVYFFLIIMMVYGCSQLEVAFEIDYFISENSLIFSYNEANKKYFDQGGSQIRTYIDTDGTTLFETKENQEKIIEFNKQMDEFSWHEKNTLISWYKTFMEDYNSGNIKASEPSSGVICEVVERNAKPLTEQVATIPEKFFYPCLVAWTTDSDKGIQNKKNMVFNTKDDASSKLRGWRQYVQPIKLQNQATDGPDYLDEFRDLMDKYGFDDTYSENSQMLDYEQYVVLLPQTFTSVGLSLLAVLIVVLFVTGSLPVTVLVVFSVVLVDVFLLGLVHYWDLTMNSIVTVFLVIGLGLSVDYSAHIAHTYLTVEPPPSITKPLEKRHYKAAVAISSMGSSVIHGGFSTFLAVCTLGAAKSYIFQVMFKTFFGIIVFGMANGFILLPIILSLIGPTPDPKQKQEERQRRFSLNVQKKGTLTHDQIAAMVAIHGLDDGGAGTADSDAGKNQPKRDANTKDFTEQEAEMENRGQNMATDNSQMPMASNMVK